MEKIDFKYSQHRRCNKEYVIKESDSDNSKSAGVTSGRIGNLMLLAGQSYWLRTVFSPLIYMIRYGSRRREMAMDHLLDNLAGLMTEDPVIRVDDFEGIFQFSKNSGLFRYIIKRGVFEPELVNVCRKYIDPHKDAIDVGANAGLFTVLFAKLISKRKVLSIEPVPANLAYLNKNLRMNCVNEKVIVYEGIASDFTGGTEIKIVDGKEEYSSQGALSHPAVRGENFNTIKIQSNTIDRLIEEFELNPGFIKIDVEGLEHRVLKGMRNVIQNFRPVILTELSDPMLKSNGTSAEEMIGFLRQFGYTVSDPVYPTLKPGRRSYGNILCLPG